MGIAMILEFVGAIVIIVYGVEESHSKYFRKIKKKKKNHHFHISISVLTNELNEVFLKLINRWDYDPRAARILKIIFEYVSRK